MWAKFITDKVTPRCVIKNAPSAFIVTHVAKRFMLRLSTLCNDHLVVLLHINIEVYFRYSLVWTMKLKQIKLFSGQSPLNLLLEKLATI